MDINALIREMRTGRVEAQVSAQLQVDAIENLTNAVEALRETLVAQLMNSRPSSVDRLRAAENEKESRRKEKANKLNQPKKEGGLLEIAELLALGGLTLGAVAVSLGAIISAALNKSNEMRQRVAEIVRQFAFTGGVVVEMIKFMGTVVAGIVAGSWAVVKGIVGVFTFIPKMLGKIPLIGIPFRLLAKTIEGLTLGVLRIVGGVIKAIMGPFEPIFRLLIAPFKFFSKFFPIVSALILAFDTIWAGWKEWERGGSILDVLGAALKGFIGSLFSAVGSILKGFDWIITYLLKQFGMEGIYKDLKAYVGKYVDGIRAWATNFLASMGVDINSLGFDDIGKVFFGLIDMALFELQVLGLKLGKFLVDGALGIVDSIVSWASNLWDSVWSPIEDAWNSAVTTVKDFVNGIVESVNKAIDDFVGGIKSLIDSVTGFFGRVVEDAKAKAYTAFPALAPTVAAVDSALKAKGRLEGLMIGSEVDTATQKAEKKKNGFTAIMAPSISSVSSSSSSTNNYVTSMDSKNSKDPRFSIAF
jgi:hypothetical protein